MQSISVQSLRDRLDREESVSLLDVRDPWEFEICHIQGAKNIPMPEIPASIEELEQDQETVVICHHGMRSLQVAGLLESLGFRQVFNLEGGMDAWASCIDTSMPRY